MQPKPGIKTTEFWISVGGLVVVALVACHLIKPADADIVTAGITNAITEIAALVAAVQMIAKYLDIRAIAKTPEQPKE